MPENTPMLPLPAAGAGTPTRWFHWILIYPALAMSLLAAVPTVWQAFRAWQLDVHFERVQIAEAQKTLWERNLDCLTARPVYELEIEPGVNIGVTLCPSGDALLHYRRGQANTYTWIPYPTLETAAKTARRRGVVWAAEDFLPPAHPTQPARMLFRTVRCVVLRHGLVLRFAQEEEGMCFVEHILVVSGQVVSRLTVPCTLRCQDL